MNWPETSALPRIWLLKSICYVQTEGLSGAETVALCREAALNAMRDSLQATAVNHEHFIRARLSIKPRITSEMLAFYRQFQAQNDAG